jgi:hypothetical protein
MVLFHLEKEPPSYAEVSIEETPFIATNKSISSNGLRSAGSVPQEITTQQAITTTANTISTDDINIPTTFT